MKHQKHYVVACPFCAAPIGHACWEVSAFKATGRKLWAPAHKARRIAADDVNKTPGEDHHHVSA